MHLLLFLSLSKPLGFYPRFTRIPQFSPRIDTFIKRLPWHTKRNVTDRSPADGISAILLARHRTFPINFRSIHLSCPAPSTIAAHTATTRSTHKSSTYSYMFIRMHVCTTMSLAQACCGGLKTTIISRHGCTVVDRSVYTIANIVQIINRQLL